VRVRGREVWGDHVVLGQGYVRSISHVGTTIPVGAGLRFRLVDELFVGLEVIRQYLPGDFTRDKRIGNDGFWSVEGTLQFVVP
jgi:hypothetical protein